MPTVEELNADAPEHDRTSCSDENPCNSGVDLRSGTVWCRRCEGLSQIKAEAKLAMQHHAGFNEGALFAVVKLLELNGSTVDASEVLGACSLFSVDVSVLDDCDQAILAEYQPYLKDIELTGFSKAAIAAEKGGAA